MTLSSTSKHEKPVTGIIQSLKTWFTKRLKDQQHADEGASIAVHYQSDCDDIDWPSLHLSLANDELDNGRTPAELQQSFENSQHSVFATQNQQVVGMARALSDGVCNAYIVDVWVKSDLRNQQIGRTLVAMLTERLCGQHIYLYTEQAHHFYLNQGFMQHGTGYAKISGNWLNRPE